MSNNTHQFVDGTNADGSLPEEPSVLNTEIPHLQEYKRRRKNMLMREVLAAEIKEMAAKSVRFKATMDSAKTHVKRELYEKKLRRNNLKVFELIEMLDRIPNQPVPVVPEVDSMEDVNETQSV